MKQLSCILLLLSLLSSLFLGLANAQNVWTNPEGDELIFSGKLISNKPAFLDKSSLEIMQDYSNLTPISSRDLLSEGYGFYCEGYEPFFSVSVDKAYVKYSDLMNEYNKSVRDYLFEQLSFNYYYFNIDRELQFLLKEIPLSQSVNPDDYCSFQIGHENETFYTHILYLFNPDSILFGCCHITAKNTLK